MRNLGGLLLGRDWGEVGCWCVTFFALLDLLVVEAVQSSPCWRKMGQNQRLGACWESFVSGGLTGSVRRENFVPVLPAGVCTGRVLYRNWPCVRYKVLPAGAKWAKISVLGRAGRVLYRVGRRAGRAGGVLYRVRAHKAA